MSAMHTYTQLPKQEMNAKSEVFINKMQRTNNTPQHPTLPLPSNYLNADNMLLLFNMELVELRIHTHQLIENPESYRALCKIHASMQDKLKWIHHQLSRLENKHETAILRQQWEQAHLRMNQIKRWLNLSKTALAMGKRGQTIFTELVRLYQILNHQKKTHSLHQIETELESIKDNLDQVEQHVQSLQEHGYTVHDLTFLCLQCTAVIETLHESIDEQAETVLS